MSEFLSSTVDEKRLPCEDGCFCERCVPGGDEDEVWDRLWEMGDLGALELVESNPKLGFKDRGCETSS